MIVDTFISCRDASILMEIPPGGLREATGADRWAISESSHSGWRGLRVRAVRGHGPASRLTGGINPFKWAARLASLRRVQGARGEAR